MGLSATYCVGNNICIQNAVDSAQAALDALVSSGTATAEEIAAAQATLDAANQALAQAQSDLITASLLILTVKCMSIQILS